MSEPVHITDHVARGRVFMLPCMRNAARVHEVLAIILAEVQAYEDLLWAVYQGRPLPAAVGVNLDTWGRRLHLARTSTDDDLYRARLEVEQLVNGSHGDSAQLQEIVSRLAGEVPVRYRQVGQAGYLLDYERPEHSPLATRADIEGCLGRATGSGVAYAAAEAVPGTLRYSTGPGYSDGGYGCIAAQEPV